MPHSPRKTASVLRLAACAIALSVIGLGAPAHAQAAAPDWSAWRYRKAIRFNTSPSGANVAGDVHNYPVAVALGAPDFDFSQAKPDGSDIRFSAAPGGEPLAHSIEHWDAAGRTALVWVKVDLVRGNSTAQSIRLHWGNPAAADASDSASVFAVSEGFVGVWHLDEEGNTAEGGYKDATANAAHGTGVNLRPGSRVEARAGKGIALEHAREQWVKVDGEKRKLFDLTNRLTFSIWVKARSYGNKVSVDGKAQPGYETMFAKGDNSWRLQKFGIRSWHKPEAELVEICVERTPKGDLCGIGKVDMALDTWYHFVGVHDFPFAKLYVNGELDSATKFDEPWTSGDHPVGIGNQSQFPGKGRSWDGVLDEARVLNVAKDAHWIKLDFESQRAGQKFLTFGATERS